MTKARKLLGLRIRELRKRKGLSLEALATKADVNDKYLGAVERGDQAATIDFIAKVAAGLHVELHELFAGRDRSPKELRTRVGALLKEAEGQDLNRVVAVLEAMLH
jgi:transcriptional regulator with XRE-family HTH domain